MLPVPQRSPIIAPFPMRPLRAQPLLLPWSVLPCSATINGDDNDDDDGNDRPILGPGTARLHVATHCLASLPLSVPTILRNRD